MADDDGFIGFKISQRDLDDEFNINRGRKRSSKNQSIYGIWADSESEDEDNRKDSKKKKDFSAPIGFVKGGFKDAADEEPKKATDKTRNESKKASSSSSKRPGFSGFAGIRNNMAQQAGDPQFAQWEAYTKGIGSKLLKMMGFQPGKGLGKNQQGITAPIEAKKRPGTGAIGAYGPESKAPPLAKPDKGTQEDDEDGDVLGVDDEAGGQGWKKGQPKKPAVKKVYTQSTEDMIAESVFNSWNSSEDNGAPPMKIIDMTGPEKRILSGLSQLHTSRAQKPKEDYHPTPMNSRFDVPELKQNLERLIRLSENKTIKGRQDYLRDQRQLENLEEEKGRLTTLIADEEWQLKQLDRYNAFVQELEEAADDLNHDDDQMSTSIDVIVAKFESFYSEEFKKTFSRLLGLDDLLLCTLGPRLRKELQFWKPFTGDDRVLNLYERVKKLTCRGKTFDILLWDYWNPAVARALQQWPTMKEYEPVMHFVSKWHSVLPRWLFEYLVGNHLLPRITREVEQWEPSKDPMPIDQWILPWSAVLLDAKVSSFDIEFLFEPIYEIIRQKLAKALGPWQPSEVDNSVFQMMKLWQNVFTEAAFFNFIESNIVPKLEVMMRSIRVNPTNQSFDKWNWVMSWREMLTTNSLVAILEKCFFPNWLFTLHSWLSQPMVNFVEVQHWYSEWKERFAGQSLAEHNSVRETLNKALMMMHHRVDANLGLKQFIEYHNPQAGLARPASPAMPQMPAHPQPYVHATTPTEPAFGQSDSINFRQMVEMKANECGILFMPLPNRFQDGKQIFQFGQYLVYIDNQVLFLQKFIKANRVWAPIRLQDLIEMCSNM